uniref:Uncharacterized protein n=1 Tax=Sus scrofa TaxID=9823 RepID=A0A4X1SPZ8_PIG
MFMLTWKSVSFGSSSSSAGRLGRLPLGLLPLENISTVQDQDSLSLKNRTIAYFQGAAMSWPLGSRGDSGEHQQSGSPLRPEHRFQDRAQFELYV